MSGSWFLTEKWVVSLAPLAQPQRTAPFSDFRGGRSCLDTWYPVLAQRCYFLIFGEFDRCLIIKNLIFSDHLLMHWSTYTFNPKVTGMENSLSLCNNPTWVESRFNKDWVWFLFRPRKIRKGFGLSLFNYNLEKLSSDKRQIKLHVPPVCTWKTPKRVLWLHHKCATIEH